MGTAGPPPPPPLPGPPTPHTHPHPHPIFPQATVKRRRKKETPKEKKNKKKKYTMPARSDTSPYPRDGYLNLTRRMDNEDEDQFDVDLTILDFLVFKAISLVFEWKSSRDPYHSDLPNALVNMTAGTWGEACPRADRVADMNTHQTGEASSPTGTRAAVWISRPRFAHAYCSSPCSSPTACTTTRHGPQRPR